MHTSLAVTADGKSVEDRKAAAFERSLQNQKVFESAKLALGSIRVYCMVAS